MFGIANVGAIVVICYLIGLACKAIDALPNKFIPIICGLSGAALGALAMAIGFPDFPATDYLTAVAVGIVSGLAATGINQIGKQLTVDDSQKFQDAIDEFTNGKGEE